MKSFGVKVGGAAAIVVGVVFAASAHAQSTVTLYGIVDSGLLYTSKSLGQGGVNAGHTFALVDGGNAGSRFGMKGAEDLGGGLKAIFDLESGISVANGGLANSNGNFFGRQAWVGLQGSFGTVQAGVQYSPFVLSLIDTDPRNISYFGSGAVIYVGSVLTTGLFNPNAVTYTSPTIAGLQGSGMIALGGAAGDFQAGLQYSGRLKYQFGGLVVDAALYSGNSGGTASSTPVPTTVEFTGRTIGVSYSYGSLTAKASYVNYKVAGSFDSRVYGGGASYKITPALNVDLGAWYTSDGNDTANHSILAAAGVDYFLSKRTTAYVQVGVVNNHGKMDTGLSLNGALYTPQGTTTGAIVGLRHNF
jgi:predicted porin